MIQLEFMPWNPFYARKNPEVIRGWLDGIAKASEQAFKNMRGYPPASSPGEYPAIRTGDLRGSIASEVTDDSVTIGSNMPYSIYLRMGTSGWRGAR